MKWSPFLSACRRAGLWAWLLTIVAPCFAADEPACNQLVASGNPEYPPFLWRDPGDPNHLVGAAAELMQRLSEEIGISITVKYVGPWGRVQEEMKQGHIDLIAGAFFTLPRLDYMDYMQPPIRNTRSVVWTQASKGIKIHKRTDLEGLRGLTVINNSFGEEFDRYAEKHLKISKAASVESIFKMLNLNRADYVLYEESPGQAYIAKLKVPGLKEADVPIANEDLFLTMSYKSACNTGELRGKITQAMHKFAREHVMDELLAKAIAQWKD